MKQNMMKNIMVNDEINNDETYEYVTHITDVDNLEILYITTTYDYEYDYEFVPEYYDE